MGLFDFFKPSPEKEMKGLINKLHAEIFPHGKEQINQEVQALVKVLNNKYTADQINKTYVYSSTIFFMSDTKDFKQITTSILAYKDLPVTADDAIIIYQFIMRNYSMNLLQTKINNTYNNMSDSEKIILAAKGGIVELKDTYKDLSDKGKFEVLLFNSLIALQAFRQKHPAKYGMVEKEYFALLSKAAKEYNINFPPEGLLNFIESRFKFFSNEIDQLHDTEEYYLGAKLYTVFYISPLIPEPELSMDLGELLKFYEALTSMFRFVHDTVISKL